MGADQSNHVTRFLSVSFIMGCSHSLISEEMLQDRKISRQLKKDHANNCKIAKLLLLGAGESGKSTIVKQMKLLHHVDNRNQKGFTDDEKQESQIAIYQNIMESIVSLLDAMQELNIPLDDNRLKEAKTIVFEYADSKLPRQGSNEGEPPNVNQQRLHSERPPPEVVQAIENLWKSTGVQQAYQRRNEFQLADSAEYFLKNVTKYTADNFVPSDQDVLRTRIQTTGVVKIEFEYKSLVFHMFDVGGQRSERKKWIHHFDNVDCVLFVVALSEYDQVLVEDPTVNRMQESLNLFNEMVNNSYFSEMPFIVFFNKKDLFEEKIKKKSITLAFPEYRGKNGQMHDDEDSSGFIIDTF